MAALFVAQTMDVWKIYIMIHAGHLSMEISLERYDARWSRVTMDVWKVHYDLCWSHVNMAVLDTFISLWALESSWGHYYVRMEECFTEA